MKFLFTKLIVSLLFAIVLICCVLLQLGRVAVSAESLPVNLFLPFVTMNATLPTQNSDGQPTWSSPILLSPDQTMVWVVNPDAGSVTGVEVADTKNLYKTIEIPVGKEPWSLAIAPSGDLLYVLDRAAGELSVIDSGRYTVTARLWIGNEAQAMALSPTGNKAYITVAAKSELVVVNLQTLQIEQRIPLAAMPYAIAVTDNGNARDDDEQIYVTHFFAFQLSAGSEASDQGRAGRVTVLDTHDYTMTAAIELSPDETGFPNLLAGIALNGTNAWVPQVRAAPDLPNELTSMVFAAVSSIDLTYQQEMTNASLPLNDQQIFGSPVNNPVAAIPSPDGKKLYVVLAGSDLIEMIDISQASQPHLIGFLPTGKNPRGLALSANGTLGYVMNYLSRSMSVLDLTANVVSREIPVTHETLSPDQLQGKIFFHNATNPKVSRGGWFSCASCHPDGGTDSVTWIFPDGPRQTPPIWNSAATLPWHWSAALDEAQDIEQTIQQIQRGQGLATGSDPAQLGPVNAGRSSDLDALAIFLQEGIRTPLLGVKLPAQPVELGRQLFIEKGCTQCHAGDYWTSSHLPASPGTLDPDGNGMVDDVLREVGTFNQRDIRGATGFDPPSLINVSATAPYFHDGSMPSLAALLRSGHPTPQISNNRLSESEVEALSSFLASIDNKTLPIAAK